MTYPLLQRRPDLGDADPGIRTHVDDDRYFLAGLPTPVTVERAADLGRFFWF